MNTKKIEIRQYAIIGAIAALLIAVLVVGAIAVIGSASKLITAIGPTSVNIENVEQLTVVGASGETLLEGTSLGAITQDPTRFDHGIRIPFGADFLMEGAMNLTSGTTTPGVKIYSSIDFDLTMSNGTTTLDTDVVMGSWCNSNDSIEVVNWWWRIDDPVLNFGTVDLRAGTTTQAGAVSFTNTTTDTLISASELATTTSFIAAFDLQGYGAWRYTGLQHAAAAGTVTTTIGSYYLDRDIGTDDIVPHATTTPFVMASGDCFVMTWGGYNATSAASYISGGGQNFFGTFHADAILK